MEKLSFARSGLSRLRFAFASALAFGVAQPAQAQLLPLPVPDTYGKYGDTSQWLCLPGRDDACAANLDVKQLYADGSAVTVPPVSTSAGPVDCFYVYPTVGLNLVPANPDPNGDRTNIENAAKAQFVPFRQNCRTFAPLYRQATIGAYFLPEFLRLMYIQVAASDVLGAFDYYLANYNQGRKIVLIGHSQGSEMLIKLMQARFDNSATVRSKLSIAILAGIPSHVPIGQTKGGTFTNIPVCTKAKEIGCFISFASYEEGDVPEDDAKIPTPAGQERVCVNPAALDDGSLSELQRRTARKFFRMSFHPPVSDGSDPRRLTFTQLANAYSGACTSTPAGNRFFAIREEMPVTDPRYGLVRMKSNSPPPDLLGNPVGTVLGSVIDIGLHGQDMEFPMGDMVALVKTRKNL